MASINKVCATSNRNYSKVAILHYTIPPVVGGVETVIASHAKLLQKNGYEVTLIAGRGAEAEIDFDVKFEPLIDSKNERINAINRVLDTGKLPIDFEKLEKEIFENLHSLLEDYDVCILHNVLTLHKNLALTSALFRLADTSKVRFISWCHDLAWTNPLYKSVLYESYPWTLLKTRHPKITYVAISPQRQLEILETLQPTLQPQEVEVVPNGVDFESFLGISANTIELIKQAGLDRALNEKAILFLLPSRITRRKNIELAIQITAALKQAGNKVRLIITGPPGPHNPTNDEYVKELIALRYHLDVVNEVIFLIEKWQWDEAHPKPVTDLNIAELYRYCDAMLMPSSQEGFGIPILEAGLARLPIFCTDLEPFHELALEDATYFVASDSSSKIASSIMQRLATDPLYRMRRRVLENFTWDSIFYQKIEPLVKDVQDRMRTVQL